MKLDELLGKLPEELRPVVAKYGPALIKMSTEELWSWVDLLIAGKTAEAWTVVMQRMDNADIMAVGVSLGEKWDGANVKNAAAVALQKEAALAVLRVLLTVALALVGF